MKETKSISVIHIEHNHFVVIEKPHGLPTLPLHNPAEDTALAQAIELFPEIKKIEGRNQDYGLLHRLDSATHGLILIALCQKAYDFFLLQQENQGIKKIYKTICNKSDFQLDGFPKITNDEREKKAPFEIQSFFRPFGVGQKSVRPVFEGFENKNKKKITKKLYRTQVAQKIILPKNLFSFTCVIRNGFRHQIRSHLAWIGYPIVGDELYNPIQSNQSLQLHATALDFLHPITEQKLHFEIPFSP
ncbi:MAG: pseudouridine synthase [Treponemataceae bacterium]